MAAWDESDRQGAGRSPEQLRRIIRYQRWLIAVVLGQLALWIGSIALTVIKRRADFDDGMNFPVLLTFILGCVGGIFVFLTAWELRGGFSATVFGLATVIPCMGLLTIVLVNGYATTELKKHNIKVGLFGASPADVADRPSLYDDDEDLGW